MQVVSAAYTVHTKYCSCSKFDHENRLPSFSKRHMIQKRFDTATLFAVADLGGGSRVSTEPPFGLDLVLRSTDDRLPSLAIELRKLLLWLTLACLSKNLDQKQIDEQVEQEVSLSKMGVVLTESGCGFKNSHAKYAR